MHIGVRTTPSNIDFETSSLADILGAYESNDLEPLQQAMDAGTTAHLRIANLSTPALSPAFRIG